MAAATTKTGFAVPCPRCGALEGLVVSVHDLNLICRECDADVTRADLQMMIDDARRLMAWLDAAETI